MALEVLRGNMTAAKAIADWLFVTHANALITPPVQRLSVSVDRVKVVLFMDDRVASEEWLLDEEGTRKAVKNWLADTSHKPLILVGVERIEVYELTVAEEKADAGKIDPR